MSIADKLVTIAENEQKVYDAGKTNGYALGRAEEYDAFWDVYQQNGARTDYGYAFFGNGWANGAFRPKYDIAPTSASYMFCSNKTLTGSLPEILSENGVTLDFSASTSMTGIFSSATGITELGIIDTSSAKSIQQIFYNANHLVTIEKLILSDTVAQTMTMAFDSTAALTNIVIEGVIQNSTSISQSPSLTHESIMSFINALCETTSGLKLTLGSTNLAKLTTEELDMITAKGWTYA